MISLFIGAKHRTMALTGLNYMPNWHAEGLLEEGGMRFLRRGLGFF
jgi:hypothetical protein